MIPGVSQIGPNFCASLLDCIFRSPVLSVAVRRICCWSVESDRRCRIDASGATGIVGLTTWWVHNRGRTLALLPIGAGILAGRQSVTGNSVHDRLNA